MYVLTYLLYLGGVFTHFICSFRFHQLLWSTLYLLQTVLSDIRDLIYLAVHGLLVPVRLLRGRSGTLTGRLPQVRSGYVRPLHLQWQTVNHIINLCPLTSRSLMAAYNLCTTLATRQSTGWIVSRLQHLWNEITLHKSYLEWLKYYKTAKPLLYTVYRTRNWKQLGRKWSEKEMDKF